MYRNIAIAFFSLTVLFFIYSGAGTEAGQPNRYDAEEIYAQSHSAVFFVRNLGEYQTLRSVGTGVVVSADGYALTAYHVTKNAVGLEAVFNDGSIIQQIEIVATDEKNDITLLKFPSAALKKKRLAPLTIRPNVLQQGERIVAIGYPLKGTPIITEGIVNSPDAEINGQVRMLISAPIVSGMSGGPIIDQQGRVAGIISGSVRTMPGIHLAIGTEAILGLIEDRRVAKQ